MKLHIVAGGHRMPNWVETGFEEYAKRMPREARIALTELKPEKREGGKSVEQVLSAEATRIKTAIPDGAEVIVLDERGTAVSTKQLAEWLRAFMAEGRDAAFVRQCRWLACRYQTTSQAPFLPVRINLAARPCSSLTG